MQASACLLRLADSGTVRNSCSLPLQGPRGSRAVHAVGSGAVRHSRVIYQGDRCQTFWFSVNSDDPGVSARPCQPVWLARPEAAAQPAQAASPPAAWSKRLQAKAGAWQALAAAADAKQAGVAQVGFCPVCAGLALLGWALKQLWLLADQAVVTACWMQEACVAAVAGCAEILRAPSQRANAQRTGEL